MIRVPRKPTKPKRESTIPLINVVFLMLVFFLVAGTLTTPVDKDVDMVSLIVEEKAPPPNMVFIREDGSLSWQGEPVDISNIKERWNEAQDNNATIIRVAVDQNLSAMKLLETLADLEAIDPENIMLVTQQEHE